jgi:hypothetical protein
MSNGIHTTIWMLIAAALVAVPQTSSACAVCMGGADSAIAPAMNAAIFLLMGFIAFVLAGLGGFAFYLYRRSKMPANPLTELSQVIYQEGVNQHA